MLSKKWMVLSLLIGNILLVGITAGNPMYTQAVLQRTLTRSLEAYLEDNNVYPGLITMRSGSKLDDAVKWFRDRKIELWAVNENPEQREWTSSPKVYADLYIDDSAIGCPIRFIDGVRHPVVNWSKIKSILESDGIL
jgi:hypothetical protein